MSEKYIHQVVKRLKCSKHEREEIKKQLTSDILSETESGASLEEVIKRMGSPKEMAEEFNSSFSENEKKKYRREKWTKRILTVVVLAAVLAAVFFWVCPRSIAIEDSRIFSKEEVQARTEEVIGLLDEGNYEALRECSTSKLQAVLNKETMDAAKGNLGAQWGEFQTFGNIYMTEISQMGRHSAVVSLNASYENVTVTYTISFDKDMLLEGLWIK